jgi:hypothetical protein
LNSLGARAPGLFFFATVTRIEAIRCATPSTTGVVLRQLAFVVRTAAAAALKSPPSLDGSNGPRLDGVAACDRIGMLCAGPEPLCTTSSASCGERSC